MQTPSSGQTIDLFGWPAQYQGRSPPIEPTPPQIPPPPQTTTTRVVLEVYSALFANAYGRPPVLTGKTRGIAKAMASAADVETVRIAITNAFADPWFVNIAGGELGVVYSQFNKYVNAGGKVATKPASHLATTRRTGLPDY